MEIHDYSYHGAGFKDFFGEIGRHIRGVFMGLKGNRTNLKPGVRNLLENIKYNKIRTVEVCRQPINSRIKLLINLIGKAFMVKDKPHDKLFHLYLKIKLDNNQVYRVEKNEDINVIPYKQSEFEECRPIVLPLNFNLGIEEMLEITRQSIGDHDFYTYDAFKTNCQRFVYDVLNSNHFALTKDMINFIVQDVEKLVPDWSKKIAYFITSLANRGKTIIFGEGLDGWGGDINQLDNVMIFTDEGPIEFTTDEIGGIINMLQLPVIELPKINRPIIGGPGSIAPWYREGLTYEEWKKKNSK